MIRAPSHTKGSDIVDARYFPKTSWTLLAAVQSGGEDAPDALDQFAQRYHRPAYGYIFAIVRDEETAEELTQAFFTKAIVSRRLFALYDRGKGSFRPYLKQSLRYFIKDFDRRNKRGPALLVRQHDTGSTAETDVPDPALSAEQAMDREWVRCCLEEALVKVKEICATKGQQQHLELFLCHYLNEDDKPTSWEALAQSFGLKDGKQARSRTDTVARHFRIVLRSMFTQELGSEQAADQEILTLLALL